MKTCEEYQMDLSAMLDGELESSEIADTVEHLAKCETCMGVFEKFKSLQNGIDALIEEPAVPRQIWKNIKKELPKEKKPVMIPIMNYTLKIVAAAALLMIMFTLGYNFNQPITAEVIDQNTPIVLASDRGNMSDERFRALTREILSADPDYIRKMYIILHTLEFEGSTSDLEALPNDNTQQTMRISYAPEETNESENNISR